VIASFDTEIKISGLSIPITFDVIDALGYDCLIGMSFLEDTLAEISLASNTFTVYGGLIYVPMTRLASVINTVYTITDVVISAFSESYCLFRHLNNHCMDRTSLKRTCSHLAAL